MKNLMPYHRPWMGLVPSAISSPMSGMEGMGMPIHRAAILAIGLVAVSQAHASPVQQAAGPSCIDERAVSRWTAVGERQIIVHLGVKRRYLLNLSLPPHAAALRDGIPLAFVPARPGQLCAGTGYVQLDGRLVRIDAITLLPS
jgi:hypothetical protein